MQQLGADDYFTNVSGNNYVPAVQGATQRAKVFAIAVKVPAGVASDRHVWVFDTAAGAAGTVAPVDVITCFPGGSAAREYPGGSLFKNGIYVAVATDEPADAATARTAAANNEALVKVDFRSLY